MSLPLVSVVMPVRNYERYIGAALESIEAQQYSPLEVIVVDNRSSDRSAAIARQHLARVVDGGGREIARSRNLGVAAARGEVIAFLDADDLWTEGSLQTRVKHLWDRPHLGVVLGRYREFIDPDRPRELPRGLVTDEPVAALVTAVVRREVFETVGMFDETLSFGDDTDWMARVQDAGIGSARLNDLVLLRRLHATSTMAQHRQLARSELLRVVKASIHRKRSSRDRE
jgi:glycosyltransferase involved in cell wall biosynthesis